MCDNPKITHLLFDRLGNFERNIIYHGIDTQKTIFQNINKHMQGMQCLTREIIRLANENANSDCLDNIKTKLKSEYSNLNRDIIEERKSLTTKLKEQSLEKLTVSMRILEK